MSHPPLLGHRGGSAAAPLIVIGVVIVGGLAAIQICRLSVRRRRRVRRRGHAGSATAVAPPAVPPAEAVPSPDARPQRPPAIAEPSGSDAADEDVVADPLRQLEREILERGAAQSAASVSRRSVRGDGAYRLGQILYDRGRLDEAAAAWRLAASKQHAGAAARLAELLEETGDRGDGH